MQEQKSVVYTIILGVCMLLCLLLMGKMLLGHAEIGSAPAQEEENTMELHITEDEITDVIEQALPIPIEGAAVKISETGTITAAAALERKSLSSSGLVPGKLRTALLFLPARCKLYAEWSAAVENGAARLTCRKMKVEGFTLPDETAQKISDKLAARWNDSLTQQGFTPQSIRWADGEVVLGA